MRIFFLACVIIIQVDGEKAPSDVFKPPFSIYGVFEIIFMFLFPLEAALKIYAYDWLYFKDFWNKASQKRMPRKPMSNSSCKLIINHSLAPI